MEIHKKHLGAKNGDKNFLINVFVINFMFLSEKEQRWWYSINAYEIS